MAELDAGVPVNRSEEGMGHEVVETVGSVAEPLIWMESEEGGEEGCGFG